MVLVIFLFLAVQQAAAQDIMIGGSAPAKTPKIEAPKPRTVPPPRPAPAPRQEQYFDISLVPDEDCIIILDGVRQRDTLRAGKATIKRVVAGAHRLSAESIATGYLHNQQMKVDAGGRRPVVIPIKEAFDAHMKRVETALLRQQ